jgi:hypothetical protein
LSTFDRRGVKVASTLTTGARHLDDAHLRVDEQGLSMDDKLVLARADIASVRRELGDRTTVHVANRKGRRISCSFARDSEGSELLAALGRSPERTLTEVALVPSLLSAGFRDRPWWKAALAVAVAIGAWMVAFSAVIARTHVPGVVLRNARPGLPWWTAVIAVAAALAVTWALWPGLRRARRVGGSALDGVLNQKLELGADGLRIPGALANDFVAYDEIGGVSARDDALVLTLTDGREVALRMEVSSRVAMVADRIRGALAEKLLPIDEDVVARLRVPGTKGSARVAALRELAAEDDASYREARIPRERLWALVEGRQADDVTRSRAAVALSANLVDAERERFRAATDASASPRVRIAVEAIEHGDDERLADRLDDIEADEQAKPALRRTLP